MNFHPCDGYYLNAEYNLTLRYALPVPAGALGGVPFETLASGLAPFSDLEIATVDVPFILGFTAPVRTPPPPMPPTHPPTVYIPVSY